MFRDKIRGLRRCHFWITTQFFLIDSASFELTPSARHAWIARGKSSLTFGKTIGLDSNRGGGRRSRSAPRVLSIKNAWSHPGRYFFEAAINSFPVPQDPIALDGKTISARAVILDVGTEDVHFDQPKELLLNRRAPVVADSGF